MSSTLRDLMSHQALQAVQKHGLRPNCIAPVCPHEGRCQLRCPVHRGVDEKQPLRGNEAIFVYMTLVMKQTPLRGNYFIDCDIKI